MQAKRAARRSAYTRAIQKPSNLVDKSEEQQNYYRQMTLAEVLDTELEFNDHIKYQNRNKNKMVRCFSDLRCGDVVTLCSTSYIMPKNLDC